MSRPPLVPPGPELTTQERTRYARHLLLPEVGEDMGRWTVEQGIAHSVPMPAITSALFMRFRSRQDDTFSGKVLAALRNEFGGHAVKEKE